MSKYRVTIKGTEVDLAEAIKGLVFAAGAASAVATADVHKVAQTVGNQYRSVPAREIESEIARILRNGG